MTEQAPDFDLDKILEDVPPSQSAPATAVAEQPPAPTPAAQAPPVDVPAKVVTEEPAAPVQPVPDSPIAESAASAEPAPTTPAVIPDSAPAPAPTAPVAAIVPAAPGVAVPPPETVLASVHSGQIGQIHISRYPIERYKASEGKVDRASVISDVVKAISIHYKQGVGQFHCWEGVCCEREGLPNIRYALPVIIYDTDSRGTPVTGEFEVKYLQLGEDAYKGLEVLHLSVPLTTIDLLVICTDEGYQKCTFQNVGPAAWLTNEQMKAAVIESFQIKWPKFEISVARTVGPEIFEGEEIGGAVAGSAPPTGKAFDISSLMTK